MALELSAELPAPVRDVIACATAADAAQRYRSAGELAAALIDALHPEQALAADHARATARSRQQQELARLERRLAELQSRVPPAPTELSGASGPTPPEPLAALDALAIAETQAAIAALRTRLLADTSTEPANPYRGLDPFEAADADRFFGREELVEELAERLGRSRLVAVLGPSGSGKSSLVLAGLLPQLQRGALPGAGSWLVRTLRPGEAPLRELATTIGVLTGRRGDEALVLEDTMRRDERVLEAELRLLMASAPPGQRLLIVIDQFEELFTQRCDEEARRMFLAALLYASQGPEGPTAFVLTMRADHYGEVAAYPAFAAHLSSNHLLVGPMSPVELRRAIEEPARLAGVVYAPGVVDVIIDDVTGRPGALPLLQQALTETWRVHRGRVISLTDYRASGGVAGALASRAQHEYEQLTIDQQSAADRLLLRLVQPGDGADDTRRRATLAEVASGMDGEVVRAIVERFTARGTRLLTTADSPGMGPTVELTHEALIAAWPRLRELLRDHRDGLRTHRRLTEAAAEWVRSGQDPTYLYGGAQLLAAQEWADANPTSPNERERAFLTASGEAADAARRAEDATRERERRDARRLRGLAIVLSVAVLVLAGLSYFATLQSQAAQEAQAQEAQARRRAESQSLAVQSQAELSRDPDLALLLAVEAAKRDQGPFVEDALHQAIARAPSNLREHFGPVYDLASSPDGRLIAVAGNVFVEVWDLMTQRRTAMLTVSENNYLYLSVAFSPDGKWLLAGSAEGNLCVWRVADWTQTRCVNAHEGRIAGLSVSSDSARVVTAGADKWAVVWDITTGEQLLTLTGHTAAVHRAAFSPDGRLIATGSWDGTLRLWDAGTGAALYTLAGHTDVVRSVAFSPDGSRLVSGGLDQTARVWDTATGQALATLAGHTSRVTRAIFSADGRQVITASGDATIKVWDAASGAEVRTLVGHEASVTSLVLADSGATLYSSGVDGHLRRWDLATGRGTVVLKVQGAYLLYAAYSRDGRLVASTATDWTARVWDTAAGALKLTVRGHDEAVTSAEFNADATRLLTASADGTARLWEISSGRELARYAIPDGGSVRHAIFSPDGRTIAASTGPWVQLLDAETLQPVGRLAGTITDTWRLAFSPDGGLLAVIPFEESLTQIDILDAIPCK